MTPDDFTRLDAAVQRALAHESCVAVEPGLLRETLRLARIGQAAEVQATQEKEPAP